MHGVHYAGRPAALGVRSDENLYSGSGDPPARVVVGEIVVARRRDGLVRTRELRGDGDNGKTAVTAVNPR